MTTTSAKASDASPTRSRDEVVAASFSPSPWGLHLLDANLVQDDLIEVVTRQAEAHAAG